MCSCQRIKVNDDGAHGSVTSRMRVTTAILSTTGMEPDSLGTNGTWHKLVTGLHAAHDISRTTSCMFAFLMIEWTNMRSL